MMDEPLHHALHCQPSTSGGSNQNNSQQQSSAPQLMLRDSESPVSPSGSNGSKNTTTTASSSASPLPPQHQQQQIFPIRSPSLNTTSNNSTGNSVKKLLFSKTDAPLSARAQLLPSSSNHLPLPPHQHLVQVHSLTKELLEISVEQKCQVWDIYHCCCSHLRIDDTKILGLAIRAPSEGIGSDRPRHEYFFLQNDQKVAKYLPKQSRFSKISSSTDKNRPVLVLYLRVKVFVERIDMIQCNNALHHYYLQLKENLLDQWSGSNSVREERCWELATLAVQADEAEYGTPSQFRAEKYFPLWVINLRGLDYVRKNMPKIVKNPDFQISSVRDAKMQFCQEASRSPFALNCHLYGLRRHKADMTDNALIGINDKGIDMWDVGSNGERIPLRSLPWNKMVRLTFDHKKLTIGGVDNSKMSLFAQSDDKARYILNFCKDVHQQLIQINLHFALNRKPYNTLPPGWGNEVCVDSGRINHRLPALPPIQASSSSTSTTPAQISPASVILPPHITTARGNSPHPLMRIHQQHSIDSSSIATTEAAESEKLSIKERTDSNASSATQEFTKKKQQRNSGGAKARIATNNIIPSQAPKIGGRYEPHQPNSQKHSRISPTYSNASDSIGEESSTTTSSIPQEIETFLNNAASPPRYKPSEEEIILPNGIINNTNNGSSSSSAIINGQQQQQQQNSQKTQQQQQQFDSNIPYSQASDAAERRSHFVASRTFDEYQTNVNNYPTTMELASRSLHDLRFQQNYHHHQQQQQQYSQHQHQPQLLPSIPNNSGNIRQPPNYHAALQQLGHPQQQQQQQRPYPMNFGPPPPMPPSGHPRPGRWLTTNGADPELMMLIERMHLQHQQYVPNQHQQQPPNRKQSSMTIEQQQEQFGVHRGVSEPRLNLSVHQSNQQQPQQQQHQNLYSNVPIHTPLPHQQSVASNASSSNGNAQKKRRYASRSPSNRGINRVKSMPAPPSSNVNMAELNGTRFNHSDTAATANASHYSRQPPPYNHALQLQQQDANSRKNALEKRHSTSGIVFENAKQYPMLNMLMHENGGMPSTSSNSEDTSTTSITTTQTGIPPRDYDRSSLESDTISMESYRQQQRDGSFADRYATTPPRPSNIIGIQQAAASSVSGSPPSPPFYYTQAGPIMWNNNNSNGFGSRGEYLVQDYLPNGYHRSVTTHSDIGGGGIIRPNGFYQSQGVSDLPAPPPYPQGSLVM